MGSFRSPSLLPGFLIDCPKRYGRDLFPSNAGGQLGSSFNTVPMPTTTPSTRSLRRWTNRLEVSPEIHLDSPSLVAILPSSVAATFRMTKGSFSQYICKRPHSVCDIPSPELLPPHRCRLSSDFPHPFPSPVDWGPPSR